jgi:hypothetical protein
MDRSGKQLENLVQEIERLLLPEGFNVDLNQRIFNDDGVQIAEFDIVITGRLGSTSINWLIECRDRPSDGPAPASWIEQLVGRRGRFKFDKVIAVSTTGFVKGAQEFAAQEGIILRTVRRITDLGSDFKVQGITHYAYDINRVGRMTVTPANSDYLVAARQPPSAIVRFKTTTEDTYQNLDEFIMKQIYPNPLCAPGNETFRFDFRFKGTLDMMVGEECLQISELIVPVELSTFEYPGKVLAVNLYAQSDEVIGQEANFYFDLPTGISVFRILLLNRPDGKQTYRFTAPENLPDGRTLNQIIKRQSLESSNRKQ